MARRGGPRRPGVAGGAGDLAGFPGAPFRCEHRPHFEYSDGFTEARAHHDRREPRFREAVLEWLGAGDHDDLALLVVQAT
ncbi:hypothetical protein Lesp02_81740 [Lentzea sp. NBRC 105346]|nr:hypothetical protein Lesp02_81740 [Lentzea sp. NBRC 105346]